MATLQVGKPHLIILARFFRQNSWSAPVVTCSRLAHAHARDRRAVAGSRQKSGPLFVRAVLVQIIDEQHRVSCAGRQQGRINF